MHAVAVQQLFDFLVRNVISDQRDIGWNLFWSVFLALNYGEFGPLGVFLPKVEDRFSSLEGAASGQMKK